jgi:uncharacterized protein (TIGR03382 family)
MKLNLITKTALACIALSASIAQALPIASVALDGSSFLQSGSVTDTNAADGITMTGIAYSLGTAADGIATWDNNGSGSLGGATQSGFLPGSTEWGQTMSWAVSTGDGGTFNFGGLDIDLILTLSPLNVTGGVLDTNADNYDSLRNAFVQVTWSDGKVSQCSLNRTAWSDNNGCSTAPINETPEPGTMLLAGLGLAVAGAVRGRRVRK